MEFALNEQQRDFAASIDAALGAADLPGVVRAWAAGDVAPGRKVWQQLANLGVTALGVAEKFDGLGASPVDLVVALERLGRWCVPGPVTESIAVAPILLAHDDQAERSHGLASGELIATVAMPPRVPRAVDADTAGLVLLAGDGSVTEGTPGDCHRSVDPSRRLYEVAASGQAWRAPKDVVARAYEFGALATAAQLVGAGQALLEAAVNYAKQRTQFGRAIGSYQAIKHKLADVHIAIELACPWFTARPCHSSRAMSAPPKPPRARRLCWRHAGRCRPTAPSGSPASMTCRCGCCGCRRCTRPGVRRRSIGGVCWRRYDPLKNGRCYGKPSPPGG